MKFNEYPYLNLTDLNLDYILNAIKEMRYEVTNFVAINAIKYANPIQWDITSQYEKNTIVIDPVTGTAYISVAPVPAGVAITRPEYWSVVFDLSLFIRKAAQNFTDHYELDTTLTATFPSNAGDWLVWSDVLYKALVNITAGDTYVIGSNIEHFTIEDLYKSYLNTISSILATIGDLDDLATSDTSSIVKAINSAVSDFNNKIGDLNDLATIDKSSIVNSINEVHDCTTTTPFIRSSTAYFYGTPSVLIDGSVQTANLQAFINYCAANRYVAFIDGTILIDDTINIPSNLQITGNGTIQFKTGISGDKAAFEGTNVSNVKISNIKIDRGENVGHMPYSHGMRFTNSNNIIIENVECYNAGTKAIGIVFVKVKNSIIKNCLLHNNGGSGAYIAEYCDSVVIDSCCCYDNGTHGVDTYGSYNVSISNCKCYGNSDLGINIDATYDTLVTNCNCYNNNRGIGLWGSKRTSINNCNFVNNTQYGAILGITIDMLPETDTNYCHDITFSNCQFWSGTSCIVALDNANLIKDLNILDCILGGTSSYAINLVGEALQIKNCITRDLVNTDAMLIGAVSGNISDNDIGVSGTNTCIRIVDRQYFTTSYLLINANHFLGTATAIVDNASQATIGVNY